MDSADTKLMNGCGPFWIANSITSTFLGEVNRDLQHKIAEENEQFQIRMEELRNATQDEIERERIKFQRRKMELTKEFQRRERAKIAQNMDRQIELPFFAAQWPLDLQASTILGQLNNRTDSLNVILLRNPLMSSDKGMIVHRENFVIKQEQNMYDCIEDYLADTLPLLKDICYRKEACRKEKNRHADDIISNADIMNIHFLMGSIPTIVILPKFMNDKIYLSAAMWDEQATRPLIRSLFAIKHNSTLAYNNEKYRSEIIKKIYYTIAVIIGTIRDQYAILTWGQKPTLLSFLSKNEEIRKFVFETPMIKKFITKEYRSTLRTLASSKNSALLNVYAEKDIMNMITIVGQQERLLNAKK